MCKKEREQYKQWILDEDIDDSNKLWISDEENNDLNYHEFRKNKTMIWINNNFWMKKVLIWINSEYWMKKMLWILDEENDELNKPWILDEGNDLNFGKGKWMHSDFWMKRMQTAWVPESSLPLSLSCKLMGIWKPMFLKPLFSLKSKLWLLPLPVTEYINSITYCKHINT